MKTLEVFHNGKRYWCHGPLRNKAGRTRYNFWSSHKWPFYHGHIDSDDIEYVKQQFIEWLPFKLPE